MKNYQKKCPKDLNLEGVTFEKTANQKDSIKDAKYIINSIQVGGLEAYKLDVDIPFKYGVSQNVGDSLGPGGVFRFLRTAPAMKSIMEDIQKYGGNDGDKPLLFNYTNPMAMVTWYCNHLVPNSTVGLCHGVQGTASLMRAWINAKPKNFRFFCAGINHMAWFLNAEFRDSKTSNPTWKNAYPAINKAFRDLAEPMKIFMSVRYDMMKATGYFMTETDGHLSEYLPYYRKRQDLLEKYRTNFDWFSNLEQASDYNKQVKFQGEMDKKVERWVREEKVKIKKTPSHEYASHIMNAMETNQPFGFNGNVMNENGSLITNLPKNSCVEIPVYADISGLHPQGGIELPTVCQALCISNIMVQKAAVEGLLELDKEKIYHAILLDPNTASVCSPSEIRDMVDDMFKAQEKWVNFF
jgi:alpha-galactosidase